MGGIVGTTKKILSDRETSLNTEINSNCLAFQDSNDGDDDTVISILPRSQLSFRSTRNSIVAFDETPHVIPNNELQNLTTHDKRKDTVLRRSSEEQLSMRNDVLEASINCPNLVPLPAHIANAVLRDRIFG